MKSMKPNPTKHFVLIVSIIMILSSFYTLYNFGYNYAKRHIEKRELHITDREIIPIEIDDGVGYGIYKLINCSTL